MSTSAFANALQSKVAGVSNALSNAREDASERESQKGTERSSSVVSVFGWFVLWG